MVKLFLLFYLFKFVILSDQSDDYYKKLGISKGTNYFTNTVVHVSRQSKVFH